MITLKINNRVVEVEAGSTILQAAKKLGIFIPTFCFDDLERMPGRHCSNCKEFGDCKICSCEVEGEVSLLTACNTLAEDGMVVWTESAEVKEARVSILNRMIASHPLDCVNCKKLGACKLQKYCEMYGVKDPQYIVPEEHREKDMSNRFYFQELDKCIRCGKCVRTCRELVGVNALAMAQMGNVAYVVPKGGTTMAETACISCGNCVSVCPVGALMPKNQHEYREWETKKVVSTCGHCNLGCQVEFLVKDGIIVDARPVDGPVNNGLLCQKGKFGYQCFNKETRLQKPMIRKNGKLMHVSWEEALKWIADKISEVKETYGSSAVAGYADLYATNEEYAAFRKLMKETIGSNMVDDNNWHIHQEEIFDGQIKNKIKMADTVLIVGDDPAQTHPVMAMYMRQAYRMGKKIIFAGSKDSDIAKTADVCLPYENWKEAAELCADAKEVYVAFVKEHAPDKNDLEIVKELGNLVDSARKTDSNDVHLFLGQKKKGISEELISAIREEQVKLLYIWGGKNLFSEEDGAEVKASLEQAFVIVQDTETEIAEYADVILPSAMFTEKEGTVTSTEGFVQKVRKVLEPAGESKDDRWIFMQLQSNLYERNVKNYV